MWLRRSYILDPLTQAANGPKFRKIIRNDAPGDSFRELKCMVYAENLLSYPYWTIPFIVHTDASDKQLGAVVSKNNKPIAFLSRIISNPQHNYTMTVKELCVIVKFLNQFHRIIFGYEINIFQIIKIWSMPQP